MTFRVLHIIGGSEFGGIVPYVASLVHMARSHGGEATVLATDPRIVEYFSVRGIHVAQIRGIDRPVNPVRDLMGLRRLVRQLRSEDYTVVHTHTSKGGIIGRLGAHIASTPLVVHTTQGYAFSDYAGNPLSRWLFLLAEKLATRWCDFIIAVNEADRQKAVEHHIVDTRKIVTIPNGIDLRDADRQLSAGGDQLFDELRIDRRYPVVGAIARLAPQKGLSFLIDAVPAILDRHPESQFVIAGSGDQLEDLEAQANRLGIPDRIRFAGFRTDIYRMLRVMNVFVMPSLWEGLPITLLEAMAARCPIVATRIKGIVDVCGNADVAALVEPGNSVGIADAVSNLLSDPNRAREMGQRARHHLESNFSDDMMIERTWAVYESIARAKGLSLDVLSAP